MKANQKKIIVGISSLVVIAAVLLLVFMFFKEKPVEGNKTITVSIIDKDQKVTDYTIKTDAEFLRQALEDESSITISGTESEYGLMVDTVNGIRADYTQDNAYWGFFVNDEFCNYGLDQQPVKDKDAFKIVYTPAQ